LPSGLEDSDPSFGRSALVAESGEQADPGAVRRPTLRRKATAKGAGLI